MLTTLMKLRFWQRLEICVSVIARQRRAQEAQTSGATIVCHRAAMTLHRPTVRRCRDQSGTLKVNQPITHRRALAAERRDQCDVARNAATFREFSLYVSQHVGLETVHLALWLQVGCPGGSFGRFGRFAPDINGTAKITEPNVATSMTARPMSQPQTSAAVISVADACSGRAKPSSSALSPGRTADSSRRRIAWAIS